MFLLLGLIFILWIEPGLSMEEDGVFTLDGDIRHFTVATNTVYIATEEKLYQLDHDLTLVQSLTLRGILKQGTNMEEAQFYRVSESTPLNATFTVNVLLPFDANKSLLICGVIDNGCGYCEILELNNISNVLHSENIQVGPLRRSSASIALLVNVEKSQTQSETYILTAVQRKEGESDRCSSNYQTVNLHNTDNKQRGGIFSTADKGPSNIKSIHDVQFVDGFQISSTIYLLSNVMSGPRNKVRLIWLEGKKSRTDIVKSLSGAIFSISDNGAEGSRLVASSVVPGGRSVLWSGVFSDDGEPSNTELVVFDISPDLSLKKDSDPDFCSGTVSCSGSNLKTLKPKAVLFRQKYMTSVLAVRQKVWMVFYMGTADGQLIKLVVDNNYHSSCPKLLYRENYDHEVFPKIHLDQVDHQHLYVAVRNQMKRVPVSNCSTFTNRQECVSAQDPNCVWCLSKNSCTFEDDCTGSDWFSIPEDFQYKPVSHKVEQSSSGQLKLIVQTHVTMSQTDPSNFACLFSGTSGQMCDRKSPPPQFPQCTCILAISELPAEGLNVNVEFRLGTMVFTEQLKLNSCSDFRGSTSSYLCHQCVKSGCGWSRNSCSWANEGLIDDSVCQTIKSEINFAIPEISSITPSVVSFHGRNHAVLSGHNLRDVIRVRIQREAACTAQEFPVWNNTGVNLTFHIPSTDRKHVVRVCVVLPDGSCHSNSKITYQSSPSCIKTEPSSSWFSGRRKITIFGSHLELVEGVIHSHDPQDVRFPTNNNSQMLTYETAAAGNSYWAFLSSVSLKVANETLTCSTNFKYLPDPEFFTFKFIRNTALITFEKKTDELELTTAELSVWGLHDGKQLPCINMVKETTKETDFFNCIIKNTPNVTFQQIMIKFGDKTVRLQSPYAVNLVPLILKIYPVSFFIVVVVVLCRLQKKLTTERML